MPWFQLKMHQNASNLVNETILALKALSVSHSVRLLWVPGHCGVEGNKIADVLAKQAACLNFVGPEPVLGLPNTLIRTYIRPVSYTHLTLPTIYSV